MAWRLGSSRGAVCSFCRFAVIRSDRALESIGRVADLVPTAPLLTVDDEGSVGSKSFRVLGRMQLDHGRGPWDEWYLGFQDGTWGWLARAEGRWYLTFERDASGAPPWDALAPSTAITLPGTGSVRWVATERGGSAVVSAEGELPYPVDPRGSGRYVDLEGDEGAFATLDYGDGSEPAKLFAGRELSPDELTLKQTAGPRPAEKVAVQKLACPSCGGPLSLFVPSETERCGCPSCGALLDHTKGALKLLAQLEPPPVRPEFALGSEADLNGERWTLIGFMQRSVKVDGDLYTFREYLLYGKSGYSWLVEEDGHWLHVATVPTSAVEESRWKAKFQGRTYEVFGRNQPTVDFVVGEFYWKVAQGDRAETADYIAPPRALSVERTENEVTWTEGVYLEPAQVYRAFGSSERPRRPKGVGAAQPNPFRKRGGRWVFALLLLLWFLLAFAYEIGARTEVVFEGNIALPQRAYPGMQLEPPPPNVTAFSPEFEVRRGPTTLEVEAESALNNGSVEVIASLVPAEGGEPRELPLVIEYYQGVSDEGAWSEGSHDTQGFFSSVKPGRYSLRFLASWAPYESGYAPQLVAPPLKLRVTRGARSPACAVGALLLIALPFFLTRLRSSAFEQRRNENRNV